MLVTLLLKEAPLLEVSSAIAGGVGLGAHAVGTDDAQLLSVVASDGHSGPSSHVTWIGFTSRDHTNEVAVRHNHRATWLVYRIVGACRIGCLNSCLAVRALELALALLEWKSLVVSPVDVGFKATENGNVVCKGLMVAGRSPGLEHRD